MNDDAPPCIMQAMVDAHFDGTITPEDERAMRLHLDACDRCRGRYRRRLLLAGLDPAALPARERIGRGLGVRTVTGGRVPLGGRVWATAGAVLALAAAVLLFVRQAPGPDGTGFTARGAGDVDAKVGSFEHQPVLRVYRVAPGDGGALAPVLDSLGRGDELAFAYDNRDRKAFLMIFGVNERGAVYWFYPAWTQASDDPHAIPAAHGPELQTLPDAIRQPLEGSRLELHALFVDEPVGVRQVEADLAAGGPARLHGADHVRAFTLTP